MIYSSDVLSKIAFPVALLGILSLGGCIGPGNIRSSDLSAKERAVRVYPQGQKPNCSYDELGIVEATSGSSFAMGTFESTVARLQQQAAERGATGLIILDHSKNHAADQGTGMAIRCK